MKKRIPTYIGFGFIAIALLIGGTVGFILCAFIG